MMNNIRKKDCRGTSYFYYIFCNKWDSNPPTHLLVTETLTITYEYGLREKCRMLHGRKVCDFHRV